MVVKPLVVDEDWQLSRRCLTRCLAVLVERRVVGEMAIFANHHHWRRPLLTTPSAHPLIRSSAHPLIRSSAHPLIRSSAHPLHSNSPTYRLSEPSRLQHLPSIRAMNFENRTVRPGYRGAFALTSLPPGTIINTETPPLPTQLLSSSSSRYCQACLAPFTSTLTAKKCSGGTCELTYYCSRSCQVALHPIHKHTCKKFSTIVNAAASLFPNHDFPLEDFLLLRTTFISLCNLASIDPKTTTSPPPFTPELISLTSSPSIPTDAALVLAVTRSFPLLPPSTSPFFLTLLHKYRSNNFGVLTPLQTVIAHGVYPTAGETSERTLRSDGSERDAEPVILFACVWRSQLVPSHWFVQFARRAHDFVRLVWRSQLVPSHWCVQFARSCGSCHPAQLPPPLPPPL